MRSSCEFKAEAIGSDERQYAAQLSRIKATSSARWIVLFSDTRRESVVQSVLKSIGLEVIVPRSRGKKIVRKGKLVEAPECPLIPGYVFCKVDIDDHVQAGLMCVKYVRGILRNDSRPVVVNAVELLKFNDKAMIGEFDTDLAKLLKPSMPVDVISGPFSGYSGVVAAVFKCEAKLILDGLGLITLPLDMITIQS